MQRRFVPLLLASMMLLSLPLTVSASYTQTTHSQTQVVMNWGDTEWNMSVVARAGPFFVSVDCPSATECQELSLTVTDGDGTIFSTSGRFHLELDGTIGFGDLSVVITRESGTSQVLDVRILVLDPLNGEFGDAPAAPPMPGEDASTWPSITPTTCGNLTTCVDSLYATTLGLAAWWNGTIDSPDDSDAIRLDGDSGDLVQLRVVGVTGAISVEVWERTGDQLNMVESETYHNQPNLTAPPSLFLEHNPDSDLWVVVNSVDSETGLYSFIVAGRSASDETEYGETPDAPWSGPIFSGSEVSLSGHLTSSDEGDSIRLEVGSRSQLFIGWAAYSHVDLQLHARVGTWQLIESWNGSPVDEFNTGTAMVTLPEGADAAAITFLNATKPNIWYLQVEKLGAADGYLFGDANDDYPTGQGAGPYASYVGESGTIAGSVGGDDNRDVFLIAREEGFPDRSWFGATLAGEMGCCTVRVVQLNTSLYSPWPVMAQNETLLSGQQASVGMDLPHGYHLLVIESNGSETVDYTLNWGWASPGGVGEVNDEDDQGNWIDYRERANSFYLFIGLVLLSPWLVIAYWRWRDGGVLQLEKHEKRRLRRLMQRLVSADPTDADDPNALLHALESLADTDWRALILEWGEPIVRHTTDSLDLAVWDLAPNAKGRTVTVGLRLGGDEWTLAAVRFQAIEGAGWKVGGVIPESLFDEDEVFLGDLKANTNRFLRIDLEGEAQGFDILLSGLVGGSPVAAVPSKAAILEEE